MARSIGAELIGLDLSEPFDATTVGEVRDALLGWKVLVVRGQHLDPTALVQLASRFGEVTPGHPTLPTLDGHPAVLPLQAAEYDDPGGDHESRWHSDVTYASAPPLGSFLFAVDVPPYGGDTSWTDLVGAYDLLSPVVQDLVSHLRAVHVNQVPLEYGDHGRRVHESRFTQSRLEAVHPVVRVHPETGERALFVNPAFTSRILDVSRRESDALLNLLFETIARPELTVRLRWEPGTLAIWDNRCTAHLAPSDLTGIGQARTLHRVTVAGDVPVGPDGFRSVDAAA